MSRFFPRIAIWLLAASFSAPSAAALPPWSLEIDRLSLGEARLAGVRASHETGSERGEGVEIRAASVSTGEDAAAHGPFSIHCPGDFARITESLCRNGSWKLAVAEGWPELGGTLVETSLGDGILSIATSGTFGAVAWTASVESAGSALSLIVEVPDQPINSLGFLQPSIPALAWLSTGTLKGSGEFSALPGRDTHAVASLEISGLDFDSPDGLYAGLGVGATLSARLEPREDDLLIVEGRLAAGELLARDFYRDFSGTALDLAARVTIGQDVVRVQRLTVGDGDALHLAGEARIPLGQETGPVELLLRELRLEFPEAYRRYLESVSAVFTLDGLETEGVVSWTGDWTPGTARSGVLRLEGLSITDAGRGRFAIRNLDGALETGSDSRITWEAASFEKLDLGAGAAAIALTQESVSLLEPLNIGLFGGHLSLRELSVGFPRGGEPDGEPDIQLQVEIEEIEMQQMSGALGWPEFPGTLSGSIPGVNWSEGVIGIEGALDFQVFNGQVLLTDLKVERPFGVLPSLAANITANALDLEQLTGTFEFGRIAGRIDGYVRELRMLDWRPVQFDAWFGTPADSGRNDISRQAVRHLASIGGGSPTALLTGPVLRLFNNFSYRRLGLGCRLHDNVCHIRGIEDQGDGVVLLEGAGIPKISILAYNRAVDWPQLVAELTAVSGGEEVRIGD